MSGPRASSSAEREADVQHRYREVRGLGASGIADNPHRHSTLVARRSWTPQLSSLLILGIVFFHVRSCSGAHAGASSHLGAPGFQAGRRRRYETRGHSRLRAACLHSEQIVRVDSGPSDAESHGVLRNKAVVSFDNVLALPTVTVLEGFAGRTSGKDSRDSQTPEDTSKYLDFRPGVASRRWYIVCLLVLETLFAQGVPELRVGKSQSLYKTVVKKPNLEMLPLGLSAVVCQDIWKTIEDEPLIGTPVTTARFQSWSHATAQGAWKSSMVRTGVHAQMFLQRPQSVARSAKATASMRLVSDMSQVRVKMLCRPRPALGMAHNCLDLVSWYVKTLCWLRVAVGTAQNCLSPGQLGPARLPVKSRACGSVKSSVSKHVGFQQPLVENNLPSLTLLLLFHGSVALVGRSLDLERVGVKVEAYDMKIDP